MTTELYELNSVLLWVLKDSIRTNGLIAAKALHGVSDSVANRISDMSGFEIGKFAQKCANENIVFGVVPCEKVFAIGE